MKVGKEQSGRAINEALSAFLCEHFHKKTLEK